MVTTMATSVDRPLIFLTAPPETNGSKHSRFHVARNLPYRDAPDYTASIYYWWWAFLKRNTEYKRTCAQSGLGKLAALHQDFGNVFDCDFLSWWKRHRGLFAEQSALLKKGTSPREHTSILYQIDPPRPLSHIQEEIKALHLQAHGIAPRTRQRCRSSAQYPIYTNASAHTLHKVLSIWDLHCENPDATAYELGTLAGLKANFLPPPKYDSTRTKLALKTEAHNKRARISVANKANRYLRIAAQYVENVGLGEFPKAHSR